MTSLHDTTQSVVSDGKNEKRCLKDLSSRRPFSTPCQRTECREGVRWFVLCLWRLTDKTDRYAKGIWVAPSGISVRKFKSRWGSCDSRGQLLFNWNIIKAPHAVADYVVVHELCHLVHPIHSKDFWAFIERFDPAFRQHRDRLMRKGRGLL